MSDNQGIRARPRRHSFDDRGLTAAQRLMRGPPLPPTLAQPLETTMEESERDDQARSSPPPPPRLQPHPPPPVPIARVPVVPAPPRLSSRLLPPLVPQGPSGIPVDMPQLLPSALKLYCSVEAQATASRAEKRVKGLLLCGRTLEAVLANEEVHVSVSFDSHGLSGASCSCRLFEDHVLWCEHVAGVMAAYIKRPQSVVRYTDIRQMVLDAPADDVRLILLNLLHSTPSTVQPVFQWLKRGWQVEQAWRHLVSIEPTSGVQISQQGVVPGSAPRGRRNSRSIADTLISAESLASGSASSSMSPFSGDRMAGITRTRTGPALKMRLVEQRLVNAATVVCESSCTCACHTETPGSVCGMCQAGRAQNEMLKRVESVVGEWSEVALQMASAGDYDNSIELYCVIFGCLAQRCANAAFLTPANMTRLAKMINDLDANLARVLLALPVTLSQRVGAWSALSCLNLEDSVITPRPMLSLLASRLGWESEAMKLLLSEPAGSIHQRLDEPVSFTRLRVEVLERAGRGESAVRLCEAAGLHVLGAEILYRGDMVADCLKFVLRWPRGARKPDDAVTVAKGLMDRSSIQAAFDVALEGVRWYREAENAAEAMSPDTPAAVVVDSHAYQHCLWLCEVAVRADTCQQLCTVLGEVFPNVIIPLAVANRLADLGRHAVALNFAWSLLKRHNGNNSELVIPRSWQIVADGSTLPATLSPSDDTGNAQDALSSPSGTKFRVVGFQNWCIVRAATAGGMWPATVCPSIARSVSSAAQAHVFGEIMLEAGYFAESYMFALAIAQQVFGVDQPSYACGAAGCPAAEIFDKCTELMTSKGSSGGPVKAEPALLGKRRGEESNGLPLPGKRAKLSTGHRDPVSTAVVIGAADAADILTRLEEETDASALVWAVGAAAEIGPRALARVAGTILEHCADSAAVLFPAVDAVLEVLYTGEALRGAGRQAHHSRGDIYQHWSRIIMDEMGSGVPPMGSPASSYSFVSHTGEPRLIQQPMLAARHPPRRESSPATALQPRTAQPPHRTLHVMPTMAEVDGTGSDGGESMPDDAGSDDGLPLPSSEPRATAEDYSLAHDAASVGSTASAVFQMPMSHAAYLTPTACCECGRKRQCAYLPNHSSHWECYTKRPAKHGAQKIESSPIRCWASDELQMRDDDHIGILKLACCFGMVALCSSLERKRRFGHLSVRNSATQTPMWQCEQPSSCRACPTLNSFLVDRRFAVVVRETGGSGGHVGRILRLLSDTAGLSVIVDGARSYVAKDANVGLARAAESLYHDNAVVFKQCPPSLVCALVCLRDAGGDAVLPEDTLALLLAEVSSATSGPSSFAIIARELADVQTDEPRALMFAERAFEVAASSTTPSSVEASPASRALDDTTALCMNILQFFVPLALRLGNHSVLTSLRNASIEMFTRCPSLGTLNLVAAAYANDESWAAAKAQLLEQVLEWLRTHPPPAGDGVDNASEARLELLLGEDVPAAAAVLSAWCDGRSLRSAMLLQGWAVRACIKHRLSETVCMPVLELAVGTAERLYSQITSASELSSRCLTLDNADQLLFVIENQYPRSLTRLWSARLLKWADLMTSADPLKARQDFLHGLRSAHAAFRDANQQSGWSDLFAEVKSRISHVSKLQRMLSEARLGDWDADMQQGATSSSESAGPKSDSK